MIDFIFDYIVRNFGLQLLGAGLLFAFFLPKRTYFPLIFPCALAAYYIGYFFLPDLTAWGWFNFKYIITFAAVFAVISACFAASVRSSLFCCFAGYLVQHASYHLMLIMFLTARSYMPNWAYFLSYFACFAIPYIAAFMLMARRLKRDSMDMKNSYLIGLAFIVAVTTQIVSMYMNYREVSNISGRIYSILACIVTLMFLFGLFKSTRLQREKEEIERLMQLSKRQHDETKENIALINMKCHDLKHQIAAIRGMRNDAEREDSLKELESAVVIYDTTAKTGNDTLDTVLTDKGMQCGQYRIKFEYMVDGAALDFMSALDIYTLFGNMLDNAIESVVRQPDEAKRIISLTVSSKNNLVSVHMENYCDGDIVFENGLPLTTKADKDYHGFGMKSIKYLAEKYNGNLLVTHSDNLFCVDIMMCRR